MAGNVKSDLKAGGGVDGKTSGQSLANVRFSFIKFAGGVSYGGESRRSGPGCTRPGFQRQGCRNEMNEQDDFNFKKVDVKQGIDPG